MSHTYRPLPPHRARPRDGGALVCGYCRRTVPALVRVATGLPDGRRLTVAACPDCAAYMRPAPVRVDVPGVPAPGALETATERRP